MFVIDCGRYVIIERRRDVDRRYNTLYIEFSFELKYGLEVEHEDISKQFAFTINANGQQNPDWWGLIKDLDRNAMLSLLFDNIKNYGELYKQISKEEETPKTDEELVELEALRQRLYDETIPGSIPLVFARLSEYQIDDIKLGEIE